MANDNSYKSLNDNDDVVRQGYLRKKKNNKRRYFVLRTFTEHGSGRLECYHSVKKFSDGHSPEKTIFFADIFSFAENNSGNPGFILLLKDDKFELLAEFHEDRDNWLEALNRVKSQGMLQQKLPRYEFIWKINIRDQGIVRGTGLVGDHRLAKYGSSISILSKNTDDVLEQFLLTNIRQSGQAESFLLLEIGRSHPLGPGELWIEAKNKTTAQDIHTILFGHSSFIRPKSYMNIGESMSRPASKTMTNRRTSDGAEKTKPGKRSFFPFLRSKLKETEAYAQKSFHPNAKRSTSAGNIHKVGTSRNGDLFSNVSPERPYEQHTLPRDTRKDSVTSKKSRRISLFGGKKQQQRQKSVSVQDLHSIDTRGSATDLTPVSSILKQNYDYCLSRSAHDLNAIGAGGTSRTCSNSSRIANIKKLSQLKASSETYMANVSETSPEVQSKYKQFVTNGRPVSIANNSSDADSTPFLRRKKWKSLDGYLKDSLAESSEECSSIGSVEDESLIKNDCADSIESQLIVDEGYMRMNFDNAEEITEQPPLDRNSIYELYKPDSSSLKDEYSTEEYMEMTPVNGSDFQQMLYANNNSPKVSSKQQNKTETIEATMELSPESSVELNENVHGDLILTGGGSEPGNSPQRVRCNRQISDPSFTKVNYQRMTSRHSDDGNSGKINLPPPATPEKRTVNKLRGFRKQMTWRSNKSPASPKKRFSEATSHFYVDTFPERASERSGSQLDDKQCDLGSRGGHGVFKVPDEPSNDKQLEQKDEENNGNSSPCRDYDDLRANEPENVRPNSLPLDGESDWVRTREGETNICSQLSNIYATTGGDDSDRNPQSVRENSAKEEEQSDSPSRRKQQHIYSRCEGSFYTEVTLKEKKHVDMPMPNEKGNQKSSSGERIGRKISSKIASSPTSESSKGYENISLRNGVITTPLNEVEGRPYVNLGFHQPTTTVRAKKGSSAHKRSSGDDAAMRQLMALQSGGRTSSVQPKSTAGDSSPNDNEDRFIAGGEEHEEAMYVNVSRDRKSDSSGQRNVATAITSPSYPDADTGMYENLSSHVNRYAVKSNDVNDTLELDVNANTSRHIENYDMKQKVRQSPTAKQKSQANEIYSNIMGDHPPTRDTELLSNEFSRAKISAKHDAKPIPAPRPKKNARRIVAGSNDTQPSNIPSKQSHSGVGSPQKQHADVGGFSYENVGRYRDNFDAVQECPIPPTEGIARSYENLADDFSSRRHPKKPVDHSPKSVRIVQQGKNHVDTSLTYADIGLSRKPDSPVLNKKSPNSDQENSPRAKHSQYTEVDFKKSQGICEAVRGRRAESTDTAEYESI
eukprot:gene12047-13290_t